jgi:hypothetical protein
MPIQRVARLSLLLVLVSISFIACKKEQEKLLPEPCEIDESYFDDFKIIHSLNGNWQVEKANITFHIGDDFPTSGIGFDRGYDVIFRIYDKNHNHQFTSVRNVGLFPGIQDELVLSPLIQDKLYYYNVTLTKKFNLDFQYQCFELPQSPLIKNLPGPYIFKTKKREGIGRTSDIDGNVYETVKVGKQVWFAQDLRTSRYTNGDFAQNSVTYPFPTHKKVLYSYSLLNDSRKLCPDGWHIPTEQEFEQMISYAKQLSGSNYGNSIFSDMNNDTYLSMVNRYYVASPNSTNDTTYYSYKRVIKSNGDREFHKWPINEKSVVCIRCIKN